MKQLRYVPQSEIEKILKSPPLAGKRLFDIAGFPGRVLEDTEVSNTAEAHKTAGDLWFGLEGEMVFIYGGELVKPWLLENPDGSANENELQAKEIKDGTEVTLKPGDWIWIPPNVPHQHKCSITARAMIIKIPA